MHPNKLFLSYRKNAKNIQAENFFTLFISCTGTCKRSSADFETKIFPLQVKQIFKSTDDPLKYTMQGRIHPTNS